MNAVNLCKRVIELDRRYLAADRASWEWIGCKGPRKKKERLHRRARRLWGKYWELVETPYEGQP